jgi:hypothetical protein
MHTSNQRTQRNELCPCGSGKKFKHCCYRKSFSGDIHQAQPIPGDGATLRPSNPPPKPITRVPVYYTINDQFGSAEVCFCYPIHTLIIMADRTILPVEELQPAMVFRLEDGGVATVTRVEPPKVYEPPSQERDANGNSLRRVIGTVKYTGYYPRLDICVRGDVLKTTPGHLFWSVTRQGWHPADSFQRGEMLQNLKGQPVKVESLSQNFYEFGTLHNLEVEQHHTYFVGGGSHGGIWTHNGMEMGCRVPRAAVAEENGMRIVTPKEAHLVRPDRHHVFPEQFESFFKSRGIDIDRYTLQLDSMEGIHGALHFGGGPGKGGGWWNNTIMERMFEAERAWPNGQQLSKREILRIGAQMRREAGLSHVKVIHYNAKG